MLVTQPNNRAGLREILSHPWMVKQFDGPPSSHLPLREPLRLGEIDPEVVKGMTGFEFGTVEEVEARLNDVLSSDAYNLVLKAYDAMRDQRNGGVRSPSASSLEHLASSPPSDTRIPPSRSPSKRFSGLDFYRKKLSSLAGVTSSPRENGVDSNGNEPDRATLAALGGRRPEELDPTRGFDPLLSIYFLVREKIEREKIYGAGVFASSTLSLNGPPPPPRPAQAYHQPAQPVFQSPREPPMTAMADATQAGRRSFSVGRRAGENLRMPQSAPTTPHIQMGFQPIAQTMTPSATVAIPPTSATAFEGTPSSPSTTLARRFGSLLGRATSMSEADYKRHRQRDSLQTARAPASTLPQTVAEPELPTASEAPISPPDGRQATVTRASTVSGSPGRTERHGRGISLGQPPPPTAATQGRASRHTSLIGPRRPSTADPMASPVLEETAEPTVTPHEPSRAVAVEPINSAQADQQIKPVYLKGLFSVATTSTKSPQAIRDDLVRVLDRLGVDHREIKGGFDCAHAPSIDLSSIGAPRRSDDATSNPKRRSSFLGITRSPFSKDRDLDKDLPAHPPSDHALSDASFGRPTSPNPRQRSRITTSSTSFTGLTSDNERDPASSPRQPQPPSPTTVAAGQGMRSHNLLDANRAAASSDLVVRFDVFVVKVPWLPGIHGLQFRRRQGNAWAYSALAKRVLADLRCAPCPASALAILIRLAGCEECVNGRFSLTCNVHNDAVGLERITRLNQPHRSEALGEPFGRTPSPSMPP
jgi:hypothetical protein